eukprot:4830562-Pyramimonas_sp.AAC.1
MTWLYDVLVFQEGYSTRSCVFVDLADECHHRIEHHTHQQHPEYHDDEHHRRNHDHDHHRRDHHQHN